MADDYSYALDLFFGAMLRKLAPDLRAPARKLLFALMETLASKPDALAKLINARAGKDVRAQDWFAYLLQAWLSINISALPDNNEDPTDPSDFPEFVRYVDDLTGQVHWKPFDHFDDVDTDQEMAPTPIGSPKIEPVQPTAPVVAGPSTGRPPLNFVHGPTIYPDTDEDEDEDNTDALVPVRKQKKVAKPLQSMIENLTDRDEDDDDDNPTTSNSEDDEDDDVILRPVKIIKATKKDASVVPQSKIYKSEEFLPTASESSSSDSDEDEDKKPPVKLVPIRKVKTTNRENSTIPASNTGQRKEVDPVDYDSDATMVVTTPEKKVRRAPKISPKLVPKKIVKVASKQEPAKTTKNKKNSNKKLVPLRVSAPHPPPSRCRRSGSNNTTTNPPLEQYFLCRKNTKRVKRALDANVKVKVIPTPSNITAIKRRTKPVQPNKKPPLPEDKRFPCSFCPRTLSSFYNKNRHETEVHGKKRLVKCELCPFTGTQPRSLKYHYQTKHAANPTPYDCEYCHKRHYNRQALRKHVVVHHADKLQSETDSDTSDASQ